MTEHADQPNVARIYDYLLGGKDHFAADRQAAQRLIAALPNAAAVARANRAFLAAAVRHAAREGIAQYLDIGAGLPTSPSVHECAREIIPGARVAYVDSDLAAVAQAQALLAVDDGVIATDGDARDPEAILASPALAGVIDLTQPVCLLLVSMLHFVTASEADMIVATFRPRMTPGSYLIISQGHSGSAPREGPQGAYGSGTTLTGRSATEIAAYFDGFDLVPPGLVPVADWTAAQPDAQPEAPPPGQPAHPTAPQAGMLAGVGRKRP
jgi:S-adenosyl methyltransferase